MNRSENNNAALVDFRTKHAFSQIRTTLFYTLGHYLEHVFKTKETPRKRVPCLHGNHGPQISASHKRQSYLSQLTILSRYDKKQKKKRAFSCLITTNKSELITWLAFIYLSVTYQKVLHALIVKECKIPSSCSTELRKTLRCRISFTLTISLETTGQKSA